jgi:hypothetical protein
MKLINGILVVTAAFFFAACDKMEDPEPATRDLEITFKALYDGNRLVKNIDYPYADYKVQFSLFTSYFSDIRLLKSTETGTSEVLLSEVEYIDFTPQNAANDSAVDVTIRLKAPEGDYTGIKMGYGVKPSLNAKAPADFPTGHPLNREVEFWPGWKSYIFNKIEGQGDGNNDGIPDIFLIYHCGSDKVYREYEFMQPITVGEASQLTVEFDLKNLFQVDNQWFDMTIPSNQFTSNLATDVRVATILMDNFGRATKIK